MDSFGGFAAVREVEVEILTDAYRVSGTIHTRFGRVTDILNQQSSSHVTVTGATVVEHADPETATSQPSVLVALSSILALEAPGLSGAAGTEMRIQKRPVPVQLAVPPLLVAGTMHVPLGSRPTDGLLNMTDRFLTMTDASITSAAFSALDRGADALAVARDRAELIIVADDPDPEEAAEGSENGEGRAAPSSQPDEGS